MYVWVLQIKRKEMENFRVKSTRSIRHVISITQSQHIHTHRQQRDALKTFLISCTFSSRRRYNFWFIFLLFWVSFEKLFVWQSEFLSWFDIFIVDLRLNVQLATTIKSSVCRLTVNMSAWPLTSSTTQCSVEQFHLVFNYVISLLHIYWTIRRRRKSSSHSVADKLHVDVNNNKMWKVSIYNFSMRW